ncbi:response regulator transcription factor [soil metagenome]
MLPRSPPRPHGRAPRGARDRASWSWDDEELVRHGIRLILDTATDIEVVGEADGGRAAVELVPRLRPQVVVMDLRMVDLDGIDATRTIVDRCGATTRVLMLTTFDRDEHLYDAIRAGASGFLLKSSPPEQLTAAVRVVAVGDSLLAPQLTRRLLERFTSRSLPSRVAEERLAPLTDREKQVLRLVGQTLTNAEIAATLFLSEGTVKTQLGRVFTKLGLRDRAQAVAFAYENSLVVSGGGQG